METTAGKRQVAGAHEVGRREGGQMGNGEAEKKVLSFFPFPLLFHHHASRSSSSHPSFFFLLFSDFIVPFFPWLLSPLFSTLYPFPSYILLLPSPLLSVHDLLVISLNTVPPPSKKRTKGKAFGSVQDPFIVLLKGIKGKPGSTDPTSK